MWNYRIFKREYPESTTPVMYELHETFYNSDDKIVAWSVDPEFGPCESVVELITRLQMMVDDAAQSSERVLDYAMEPEGDWDEDEEDDDSEEIHA